MYSLEVYIESFGGEKEGSSEPPRTPPAYEPATHANTFFQFFVYVPSGTGMHYLRSTLQAHGSALIQTPLVPTSQMTPACIKVGEPTQGGDMGMGIHQAQTQYRAGLSFSRNSKEKSHYFIMTAFEWHFLYTIFCSSHTCMYHRTLNWMSNYRHRKCG